ncbi:MAG: hypothetical protein FP816_01775 [Desulfobacteraceae bacterium]|nr:hypothetical protein [Desulfobacteraceae bacterium]MBU4001508.1 hypothetical protein [Pseudomonadota bacterium]MBU4054990.1 hypothetical protein [Pseudomonadota bacterium]
MIRHAGMLEENRAMPHVIFSDSFYTRNPDRKGLVKNVIFNYLAKIEDIIQQGQKMKNIHITRSINPYRNHRRVSSRTAIRGKP